jgi:sodium-dependent dicarboxylate transporter 2/3/5
MWGGLALGAAISKSDFIPYLQGLPAISQFQIWFLPIFAFTFSFFISNTAAANLFLPLAFSIKDPINVPTAILTALACSFGMLLPVSTPPNAIAFSTGQIKSMEMARIGILLGLSALIVLLLVVKNVIPLLFKVVL